MADRYLRVVTTPGAAPHAADAIEVVWHPIARLTGGGFAVGDAVNGVVVVDPALDEAHRRTVIAHERAHLTRGISPEWAQSPSSWAAVMAREELLVNREAARQLAPTGALQALVTRACARDEGVTASTVALAFDITVELAAVALELLMAERHCCAEPPCCAETPCRAETP